MDTQHFVYPSSADGHIFVRFQFLAAMNKAAADVSLSFWGHACFFLLGKHIGMDLLGHRGGVCLMHVEELLNFSKVGSLLGFEASD